MIVIGYASVQPNGIGAPGMLGIWSDEHVEGLMRSGLDELALSLHGLSEESYQAYQPGFAFDEAVELLKATTGRVADHCF